MKKLLLISALFLSVYAQCRADEPDADKAVVHFGCGDFGLSIFANKDNPEYIEIEDSAWSMGYDSFRSKLDRIESEDGNQYSNGQITVWNEGSRWKILEGHECSYIGEKMAEE